MTQHKNRLLKDWIDSCVEYAEETEPPRLFKIWSAIAAISSVLERKCYIEWGIEGRLYPNMFIVLCGPSSARKGTAMKKVGKLLATLQDEEAIRRTPDSCSREKLLNIVAGALKGEGDDRHCSVTVYATELTVFIDKQAKDIISDLNKLFDCEDSFEYATKHQGTDLIHNVYVTLFGATTPGHIQSEFPPIATTGGFTSRVVFVFGDKKDKRVPLPVSSPKLRELERRLMFDLNIIHKLAGEFYMTPEFLSLYEAWYMNSENDHTLDDNQFHGYIGRRADHIRKLSIIFSASRGNSMRVEAQDFEQAKALLYQTEKYMPFVFSGCGRLHGSNIIETLLATVSAAKGNWILIEDVFRRFIYDATWEEMLSYAETLKHVPEIEYALHEKTRKPQARTREGFVEKD